MSMNSVDIVHVHCLPGECPGTAWIMSMDSVESDTLDNIQADWTMSTESMGSVDIVHGQSPLFFPTELVKDLELE